MSPGGLALGVARSVFWASGVTIVATYVVFPVGLLVRGALMRRPVRSAAIEPTVSVIIAARNEAAVIGRRLENLAALDYPRERLEVVIASDGSEDATAAIVADWSDRGVRLVDLPRVGKADALNAAVAASSGEVLVFSDANSMFAPDAVRALVRRFADPEVGGVAGDQRYEAAATGDALAEGERGYWDLDRLLKMAESRAGNVVSATGAIYAIRRELFRPVTAGVTDDFITSVAVVAQHRRLVFARDAVAYEPPAVSGGDEFGRKVRIMTRGLRGTILMRELLDPRQHGFYAVQLAWHKIFRRLMVVPLLGLFASSLLLVGRGRLYTLAALAQLGGYALGVAGLALRDQPLGRKKVLSFPAFFCLVNLAALQALRNIATGRHIDRWEPQRGPEKTPDSSPREHLAPIASAVDPLDDEATDADTPTELAS
jgi:cellulose synthase/poly-beta-1,6-N-acetylglucosamine synthase-like glycosyltransferase